MGLLKKIKPQDIFMLLLCAVIILVAEYLFLNGDQYHGIFIGLWAPTVIGIAIYIKLIKNGR
jgi:uncharacterized membrane protein YvlD (DUF360 family)